MSKVSLGLSIACVTAAVCGSGAVLAPSPALAQATPRSICCTQLKGRWEENRRTKEMRCFGVNTNEYYKCVSQKTR